MTVVTRRISAIPARSSLETWEIVINLIAPDSENEARKILKDISGVACSLIAEESFKSAPAIVYGAGTRLRMYCLYGDDAIAFENANESQLAFVPTDGEWKISLPCPAEDLTWVNNVLKKRTDKIAARDMTKQLEDEPESKSMGSIDVNREAFFRS